MRSSSPGREGGPEAPLPDRAPGEAAQADLALLASRDCLVKCRSLLINHVRGVLKSLGGRIPDEDGRCVRMLDQIAPPPVHAGP